jgi:hypothetical protein
LAELKLKELKRNFKNKTLRPLIEMQRTPKTIIKGKDLMFARISNDKGNNKILRKALKNGKVTY